MEHIISQLLPSLEHFHYLPYWLAFFAALLETALLVALIIPGSSVLLLLGAYAAGGNVDLVGLWWFAITGAILGDNINYYLGKHYGNRWVKDGLWLIKPMHFDHSRQFFDRHGARSIFLGRFIPGVKELIPFVAGTVKMRRWTFMLWNVLGAMGWGLEWLGAGYLFAQSLNIAQLWLPRVGMLLLLVVVLSLILWGLQRLIIRYGRGLYNFVLSVWLSIREAVTQNTDVIDLVEKHPHFFSFIKQRLDRSHFYGFTLTLLFLALVYVLILFSGIVEDIVTADPIVQVDKHIAQLVTVFRTPEILQFFTWVTELGNPDFVIPFVILICTALVVVGRGVLIIPLFTSLVGSFVFTQLGKLAFQRPRPVEAVLLEHSYSFPSGHATLAMGFYGFLTYLLIRQAVSWKTRVHIFFGGTLLIFLLGLSRIIIDVHYISDVWGGYLVGAMWLIICISLTEWLASIHRINFQSPINHKKKWVSTILVGIACGYFLVFAALHQPLLAPELVIQTIELDRPLVNELEDNGLQYTSTILGDKAQPVGVAILAQDDSALIEKLQHAGWQSAQKFSLRKVWQEVLKPGSLGNISLAPVFWNTQINDFAFVLAENNTEENNPEKRMKNTFRVWKTPYRIQDNAVYLGVTRHYDEALWRLFHTVNIDIDASKDDLLVSLKNTGEPAFTCSADLVQPMSGKFMLSGNFFTHGKLVLLELTPKPVHSPWFCSN